MVKVRRVLDLRMELADARRSARRLEVLAEREELPDRIGNISRWLAEWCNDHRCSTVSRSETCLA